MDQANYPRSNWWVAAQAEEVGDQPVARWLLDEPVVMFRTSDGVAHALEDRCAHRWAPLSGGRLVDDALQCPYHGARFGVDGRCVKVPTQNNVPPQARVRAYPLAESDGLLWIWMGPAEEADEAAIPRFDYLARPGWYGISGYYDTRCNYLLIQENVLDLTHFAFLHATTLEQSGWDSGNETQTWADDESTGYRKSVSQEPLAPFLAVPLGIAPGQPVDRIDWGTFVQPAVHIAGIDFDLKPLAEGQEPSLHFRITHLTTPASAGRTHYWWIAAQNAGNASAENLGVLREIIEATFQQDKDLLETIQSLIETDHRGGAVPEVSFVADRPGLHARRLLQKRLDREGKGAGAPQESAADLASAEVA